MRKGTFVSILLLLALLLSANLPVALAQKLPSAESVEGFHRLLRPDDVSELGNARLITPENSLEKGKWTGPGALVGWEKARSTSNRRAFIKPGGICCVDN
jgi:hypothetical protein